MRPTIGIIGGMGPMATCDIMRKIIVLTGAKSDQDNYRIVVDSNTDIPDRTEAILHGGKSPVKEIVRSARCLEVAGADVLLMACNTAHYFFDEIDAQIDTPMLNMIDETAQMLGRKNIRKAGLLATEGTVKSGIFEKALSHKDIQLIYPDAVGQQAVTELVYDGIKADRREYDTSRYAQAVSRLRQRGAQIMILGCTELPLVEEIYGLGFDSVDPTLIVAQAAVDFCRQMENNCACK